MNLDEPLAVETELDALLTDGHPRARATELVTERAIAAALTSPVVVLVEGVSDQIAVEIVATRIGRRLRDEGVAVDPMGGATNIGRMLRLFGRRTEIAGLYDSGQEVHIARALGRAGRGGAPLEARGFFGCCTDLEDELVRALGPLRVEQIIESEGQLSSFRTMRNEPFHRARTHEQQVHRFIGRLKYRYARLLAVALDLDEIPRPLRALLSRV